MAETAFDRDSVAEPAAGEKSAAERAWNAVAGRLVILVPYLWLLFFFLIPFAIVFKISLSQTAISMPPYDLAFDGLQNLAESISFKRQPVLSNRNAI